MLDLIKLAQSGEFTPLDFVIAARHISGYNLEAAAHIENQYFDGNGYPISDVQFKKLD